MQKAANSKIHLRQQLFRLLRNQEGDISLNITQEDQRDRLIACDIANKIRKAPKADVDTSSMVGIVAVILVSRFITKDAYLMGYKHRELEFMLGQEKFAVKHLDRMKNSGMKSKRVHEEAKRKRIEAFMVVHAKMIADNPAMEFISEPERAYAALHLAKKSEPDLFKKVSSKKTAVEYWEYIRSDSELSRKHQLIQCGTGI